LYQVVVCKHIFCRHCIETMFKTSDKATCTQCSQVYSRSEVVKYH